MESGEGIESLSSLEDVPVADHDVESGEGIESVMRLLVKVRAGAVESGEGIERRRELVFYEIPNRHVESGEGIESSSAQSGAESSFV